VARERVQAPAEEGMALQAQRRDPLRLARVQAERELDELPQLTPRSDRKDLDRQGGGT